MLIFPVHNKLDWHSPPFVTLGLILVNVLIYGLWQTGDDKRLYEAITFYKSKPALAHMELNAFKDFLQRDDPAALDKLQALREPQQNTLLIQMLNYNQQFMGLLKNGLIISKKHPDFSQWQRDRQRFDVLFERVSTQRFGFKPAEPAPLVWLASLFLHGNWEHLAGNMLFLFLFGYGLEAVLGARLYLGLYLLSGLSASALHSLVNWGSIIPTVGASGAIAGLMGAYSALYGLQKIRFFYWVIVYFNYIRLPALVVLPLWISKELYDHATTAGSNVAYFAHIGGLAGGALLIALAKKAGWITRDTTRSESTESGEEEQSRVREQPDRRVVTTSTDNSQPGNTDPVFLSKFQSAMDDMAALEFDGARRKLMRLLQTRPNDIQCLEALLKIESLTPHSPLYKKLIFSIMALPTGDEKTSRFVLKVFNGYTEQNSLNTLSVNQLLKMLPVCIQHYKLYSAEKLLSAIMDKDHNNNKIPDIHLAIALAYKKNEQTQKYLAILIQIEKEYAHTAAGDKARQLLDRDYDKRD